MINYYYKYLELIDTVFLAIKKKPLGEPALSPTFASTNVPPNSIPPCLPPLCYCPLVLHSA